jgi:hypothetical protein
MEGKTKVVGKMYFIDNVPTFFGGPLSFEET